MEKERKEENDQAHADVKELAEEFAVGMGELAIEGEGGPEQNKRSEDHHDAGPASHPGIIGG
jgi:hypothetical protein